MSDEKEKKGKKKGKGGKKGGIDLLTIIGLVAGLGLMWFGISYAEEPQKPDEKNPTYTDLDGNLDQEKFEEANKKYEKNLQLWNDNGGVINVNQLGAAFIDIPSIAITIGGTFAALMIAFPLAVWSKVPKLLKICFLPNKYDPQEYIEQIVGFAKEARVKGLLSLEDKLNEAEDPFLKSSLMLVVDSVEPEKVHNLLSAELDKLDERHGVGRAFMDSGGAFAPGFGMIGTLIGLINMLGSMDDPSSIGPAMATALLTTLYGSMLANLIFSPMSAKLGVRHDEEYLCRELICEGVEAIQAGENPKFIEEKLNLLVVQKQKKDKKKKGKGKGGDEAAEA